MLMKTSHDQVARPGTARREAMWLKAVEEYFFTPQEIADAANLSVRRVQMGLKRARGAKLDFFTVFDVEWIMCSNPFTAEHQCQWHNFKDIPKGIRQGCLFCLKAGLTHLMGKHGKPIPGQEEKKEPGKSFAERKHGTKKVTP